MNSQVPAEFQIVIGDIGITPDGYVVTPQGSFPIRGTRWQAQDMSLTTRVIPGYAIVLTIIFAFFFLLGLLFLLIRQERTTGWVQVSVTSEHGQHFTQVSVNQRFQVQSIFAAVGHAQAWSQS